jgi:tetratricopeptide (TPR) repeat protein
MVNEIIRAELQMAELHYKLGVSLLESMRYEEAEKEFREAIRLNPNHVRAINDLGVSLAKLRRYEEAEKEWRRGLSVNSKFSSFRENYYRVLWINLFAYIRSVVSKGPLFFITKFWAFIFSFIVLWWAGLIITQVHFSELLSVLWSTLKFLLLFLILVFFGFCAIESPSRYRVRSGTHMYDRPVVSIMLITIIIGAIIEGIFRGLQAAFGGAIGAGLVGLGGILGMFLGRAFQIYHNNHQLVVIRGITWSLIISALTVLGISLSESGQDYGWFPWIKPALAYAGGESGALGAMVAGALITGACLASWIYLDRFTE